MSTPATVEQFAKFVCGKKIVEVEAKEGLLWIELEGGGGFQIQDASRGPAFFLRFRTDKDDPDGDAVALPE